MIPKLVLGPECWPRIFLFMQGTQAVSPSHYEEHQASSTSFQGTVSRCFSSAFFHQTTSYIYGVLRVVYRLPGVNTYIHRCGFFFKLRCTVYIKMDFPVVNSSWSWLSIWIIHNYFTSFETFFVGITNRTGRSCLIKNQDKKSRGTVPFMNST